jgi:hypothetical protein
MPSLSMQSLVPLGKQTGHESNAAVPPGGGPVGVSAQRALSAPQQTNFKDTPRGMGILILTSGG